MESRFQDAYQTFAAASDKDDLFAKTASFAKDLGFEYCCCGIRMPLPVSNPIVRIFDTYPPGGIAHYRANDFLDIDPIVRAGEHSSNLIIWPGPASDMRHDSGPTQTITASRSAWRIRSGPHAGPSDFWACRVTRTRLTNTEVAHLQLSANWLSQLCHMRMGQFLQNKLARGTGEGKTSYAVGKIPDIFERTVNFHVNNVLAKLAATSQVQAVVKAIATGII